MRPPAGRFLRLKGVAAPMYDPGAREASLAIRKENSMDPARLTESLLHDGHHGARGPRYGRGGR